MQNENLDIYNENPFATDTKEPEGIDIVRYIGYGRLNAKTRSELCKQLNLTDRVIRRLIHDERIKGVPIINVGNGYYFPDMEDEKDVEELSNYIFLMKSRYNDIGKSIDALTNWLVCSLS